MLKPYFEPFCLFHQFSTLKSCYIWFTISLEYPSAFVHSFYPPELACKKENDGLLDATFLDLEVAIIPEEGRFSYHLFDKRDNFNFFIVRCSFSICL